MPTSVVHDEIPVLRASGTGGTPLAAFHDALVGANLAQYNIVRLSSVVPPETRIDGTGKAPLPTGAWGDRVYCVYAEQHATVMGEEAWAGIGWIQRLDGRGGLFVEHEGGSEQFVVTEIRTSLQDLSRDFAEEFGPPEWVVEGVVCSGRPVCSLVIAPYECESWTGAR